MDSKSIEQPTHVAPRSSRLPAGSTFEVSPGVHVPHPHAEVNKPGMPDPRLGNTKAVTESIKLRTEERDRSENENKVPVTVAELQSRPLADEVKPKVVTAAPLPAVEPNPVDTNPPAASDGTHLAVEADSLEKTA